jgi:hypothetical protein
VSHFSDYEEGQQAIAMATGGAKAAFETWLALFTTAPDDAGVGGVEVSGGSYARVRVFQDGTTVPYWTAIGSLCQNVGAVTWPQATADWGEIEGVAVMDDESGGNFRFVMPLTPPFASVVNGQILQWADGVVKVAFD